MNFIVSLAKIPGGLFAAIYLKNFSRRPVFLACAFLIVVAHLMMGLTYLDFLPSKFAMVAIAIIQFASTAGFVSVAGLLLGSLLPSSSRSTFAGIIMTIETMSALSQGSLEPYILEAIGESGLFFVFGSVVMTCLCYMFILMPETKGKSLEELEHIFLSPKQKGCIVRREPHEAVASLVTMVRTIWGKMRLGYTDLCSTQIEIKLNMQICYSYLSFRLIHATMLNIPCPIYRHTQNGASPSLLPLVHQRLHWCRIWVRRILTYLKWIDFN